jgi:hypothetical protein
MVQGEEGLGWVFEIDGTSERNEDADDHDFFFGLSCWKQSHLTVPAHGSTLHTAIPVPSTLLVC